MIVSYRVRLGQFGHASPRKFVRLVCIRTRLLICAPQILKGVVNVSAIRSRIILVKERVNEGSGTGSSSSKATERVLRSVSSGLRILRPGRRPGGGGEGGDGASSSGSSPASTKAGFNRATEISSETPPGSEILKEWGNLEITL